MAVIKQGILGGGSGKIGNVTMTSWKGRAVIKARPLSVANPQTAGQVTNRSAFKACSEFASSINSTMIIPLMNRFAGDITGNNMFMSRNKVNFDETGLVIPEDLNFGTGKLGITPLTSIVRDVPNNEWDATWSNVLDNPFKLATDKVYLLITKKITGEVYFMGDTGATRVAGTVTVESLITLDGSEEVDCYLVFLRADGTQVGDTAYREFI